MDYQGLVPATQIAGKILVEVSGKGTREEEQKMRDELCLILCRLQDRLSKYVPGKAEFIRAVCTGSHAHPEKGEVPSVVHLTVRLTDMRIEPFSVEILWAHWDSEVTMVASEIKGPGHINVSSPAPTHIFSELPPGQRTDVVAQNITEIITEAISGWQEKGVRRYLIDEVDKFRKNLLELSY